MKRTRLFLIGALGIALGYTSCGYSDGKMTNRQLYNNETFVDSEGYTFFKTVHEKASYELAQARYVIEQGASGDAKTLAEKVIALYSEMVPELEALAADKQVLLPDPSALAFKSEYQDEETAATDSTQVSEQSSASEGSNALSGEAYVAHLQKEQAAIVAQFKRVTRNTDKELRKYATEKLDAVKELYTLAGGSTDEHAHH